MPMRPTLAVALLAALAPALAAQSYPSRVEIRRTAHGVPHILAQDLGAMGYGLAWAQLEDHGERIVLNLVRARGELARLHGRDSLEADFTWCPLHQRAVATWDSLDADVQAVMTGWAAAVNRWVETHPDAFQAWALTPFTPQDAAALWGDETVDPATSEFRRALARHRARADSLERDNIGSNAWAFGPRKTRSGRAILLRNPHLGWDDLWFGNYYEAHVTVPGVINFYGDFRVGFPLYFNGGFNVRLGWATTNNAPDLE